MKNIKIEKKKLLLVEGKDEVNFFEAILKHEKINDVQEHEKNIQILDVMGKNNFKNIFKILTLSDGFANIEVLGFIQDADNNKAKSAFDSLSHLLKAEGFCLKTGSIENNIFESSHKNFGNKKIGIFIMPNNRDKGALEDLCLLSIDPEMVNCIDGYINCCSISNKDTNISKAKIQSYLAVQEPLRENLTLGLAATKGIWQFNHSSFDQIKQFLKKLFNSNQPHIHK